MLIVKDTDQDGINDCDKCNNARRVFCVVGHNDRDWRVHCDCGTKTRWHHEDHLAPKEEWNNGITEE